MTLNNTDRLKTYESLSAEDKSKINKINRQYGIGLITDSQAVRYQNEP